MNEFEEAKQVALTYLDFAARTRVEIERRLRKSEYEDEIIEAVVAELERMGVLDDVQFSEAWVESRARSKKLGRVRLAAELRRKGIDRELVEQAVGEIRAEDEVEAALALAQKRLRPGEPGDPAVKRRLAGYLQRRGYNWEIIEQVFVRMFANSD